MSSSKVSPGKHICNHHLSSIAPELISKADVLKDMVMLRKNVGKGDSILSEKEIELVIHTACTDQHLSRLQLCFCSPAHLCLYCVYLFLFSVPCVRFYNNNNNTSSHAAHRGLTSSA